jgi:hypothetical protein
MVAMLQTMLQLLNVSSLAAGIPVPGSAAAAAATAAATAIPAVSFLQLPRSPPRPFPRVAAQRLSLKQLMLTENENNSFNRTCTRRDHEWIHNSVVPSNINSSSYSYNKIPNQIHQTSKSKCLHMFLADVSKVWREMNGYSYYLHDDDVVWRFLHQQWPEFPTLPLILPCLSPCMTAVADLWRYLILYEFGGIYSDLDAIPKQFNASWIHSEDDALFVVENFDAPSQYWMAVAPKHPLMYYAAHHALHRASGVGDVFKMDAAKVTGPFALMEAFASFMLDVGLTIQKPIRAGHYEGRYNRSIRIIGHGRERSDEIIKREAVSKEHKFMMYHSMNMKHYHEDKKRDQTNKTCLSVLHDGMQSKQSAS